MSTFTSTIKELVGVKKTNPSEARNPDEEIKEYLEKQKEEMLARARMLELEELLKKRELSIAELESKIEALRGRPTAAAPALGGSILPKLSKEELEVVKLLLEMNDEDRIRALQMLMMLKGGGFGAVPIISGSKEMSVKDIAEAVNAIISAAKALTPTQSTESGLLNTLISKLLEMAEKRQPREEQNPLNEAVNMLLKYALEQVISPRGSDIDYMADRLDKLRSVVAMLMPQQGSSDIYKVWLELKKLDQDYEKWKTEMEMKRRSEEEKINLVREIIGALEPGRLVRSAVSGVLQASRGQTSMPTILCDPNQGGCGARIPIPPGVSEVVCARCGSRWGAGAEAKEAEGASAGESKQTG